MKVQTRVPDQVGTWLMERAEREGILVAQVARDLIVDAYRRSWIRSWIEHKDHCDPRVMETHATRCPFVFEVLSDMSGGELVVALLHGETAQQPGVPVSQGYLRTTLGIFNDLLEHRAILDGSPRPWLITRAWWNAGGKRMELTLSPRLNDVR